MQDKRSRNMAGKSTRKVEDWEKDGVGGRLRRLEPTWDRVDIVALPPSNKVTECIGFRGISASHSQLSRAEICIKAGKCSD